MHSLDLEYGIQTCLDFRHSVPDPCVWFWNSPTLNIGDKTFLFSQESENQDDNDQVLDFVSDVVVEDESVTLGASVVRPRHESDSSDGNVTSENVDLQSEVTAEDLVREYLPLHNFRFPLCSVFQWYLVLEKCWPFCPESLVILTKWLPFCLDFQWFCLRKVRRTIATAIFEIRTL